MRNHTVVKPEITPEIRQGIIMWVVKAAVGLPFIVAILFLAAGRWDWVWGWVFVGLFIAASIAHVLIMIPINPALLAERSKGLREEGAPKWDKFLTGMGAGLLPMLSWIIAGLNVRFGWPPPMPLILQLGGVVVFLLGWGMVLWATAVNTFFTTTVRIQKERGHTVQTSGPYQFVRHPGYLGALVYQLATPFLLGSWWAFIPMVLAVPFFIVRIVLEERLLRHGLAGYREYTQQVSYRLIPGVW